MRVSARELLVSFFYTFGMVQPPVSNPQPPVTKADTLPTELLRRSYMLTILDDLKNEFDMKDWSVADFSIKIVMIAEVLGIISF